MCSLHDNTDLQLFLFIESFGSLDGNVKDNVPLNNNISRLKKRELLILSSGVFTPSIKIKRYLYIIHVSERRQYAVKRR